MKWMPKAHVYCQWCRNTGVLFFVFASKNKNRLCIFLSDHTLTTYFLGYSYSIDSSIHCHIAASMLYLYRFGCLCSFPVYVSTSKCLIKLVVHKYTSIFTIITFYITLRRYENKTERQANETAKEKILIQRQFRRMNETEPERVEAIQSEWLKCQLNKFTENSEKKEHIDVVCVCWQLEEVNASPFARSDIKWPSITV